MEAETVNDGAPDDQHRTALPHGSEHRPTNKPRTLKDAFSPGDWIVWSDESFLAEEALLSDDWALDGYGRVVAVRDSEMDVDYGSFTSTITDAALSYLRKVDGPESGHPGKIGDSAVYFTLGDNHGMYTGKRGRLTGYCLLADGPPDGHFGKYFQVEFAGDPTPVWIHEDCVHGLCRKDASYHPELWYSKA